MDQNTGKGGLETVEDDEDESFIGKERARNKRIDGRRGRARLRENKRAAENAKAERKSRKKEWLGWETRK